MDDQIDAQALATFVQVAMQGGLPQFIAYAITTGDAATADTVVGLATSEVTVWLDGTPQTPENKKTVTMFYGQAAPAAGQLWLVLLCNFERSNGVLLGRTG